ncbi:GNAT family N-acetyltransferase [Paucisalibacillus sp. EB02]|uniref:GNAT family N-acetyltransferase n=1 Tax=Paucisalibacillus sp. EB02 TaxID=1347087 RepID=UPI0004B5EFA3|nr:GNAT family N-acetyltransferase [Paucisalibacillus sp. EB02]
MVRKVKLIPHDKKYAKAMSALSSSRHVKDALGLSDEQTSIEGTKQFIEFIRKQEKLGKQYSRCIINDHDKLIGVITLKDIDMDNKTCHIGTWIGQPYWGQGYNESAKAEILYVAFHEFNLEYVFAGAKVSNIRSQKAQEKLPYIRLQVENEFPAEHKKLENQVKSRCMLNVIEREDFLNWYNQNLD